MWYTILKNEKVIQPMPLPEAFQFSQTNLQDYTDCQRRFELRHILRLNYPSVESEPQREHEAHQQRGTMFHRMVHQFFSGVSAEQIGLQTMDADLRRWWSNFVRADLPIAQTTSHEAEITLSTPLAGYRLIAKYDLVAQGNNGHFWVMDWKTQPKPPSRDVLQLRLQTAVYPYVLARAGHTLTETGEAIPPEHIHMAYWFAETGKLEIFDYSTMQMHQDETHLQALIQQIHHQDAFPLTDNDRHCLFCTYRSLCNRNVAEMEEMLPEDDSVLDIDPQFDLDWESL